MLKNSFPYTFVAVIDNLILASFMSSNQHTLERKLTKKCDHSFICSVCDGFQRNKNHNHNIMKQLLAVLYTANF